MLALSLKGISGDTVVSYMLWVILKTSITSPRKGPYFRVGRFKYINLSMYNLFCSLITSLVARRPGD